MVNEFPVAPEGRSGKATCRGRLYSRHQGRCFLAGVISLAGITLSLHFYWGAGQMQQSNSSTGVERRELPTVVRVDSYPPDNDDQESSSFNSRANEAVNQLAEALAIKMAALEIKNRNPDGITLGQAFADFLSVRPLKDRTRRYYSRCFKNIADWSELPIHQIRQHMILDRHRAISQRNGSPVTLANNVMRALRAIVYFAITYYETPSDTPIVNKNPVRILSAVGGWNRDKRRETFVRPHELPRWFAAVQRLSNETARDLMLFLLFTGLRKSEAGGLKWEDVDFRSREFTIRDTKNGDDHTLPMSTFTFELLWKRHAVSPGQYVFHGRRRNGAVGEWSYSHRYVSAQSRVTFTYHDLRRTFLTVADSLNIPKHVIKRLANHKTKDVTDGYLIYTADRLRDVVQQITDKIFEHINTPECDPGLELPPEPENKLAPLGGWVEARILELVAVMANPSVTTMQIHFALWPDESERRVRGSTGATVLRLEKRGYLVMVKRDRDCTKHYALSEAAKRLVEHQPVPAPCQP
jgi:integrase